MNEYILWAIIVVVVAVAVPVIAHAVRQKDFKDQVSGKKPERKLTKDPAAYTKEGKEVNQELERLKLEMQQKTKDNIAGI